MGFAEYSTRKVYVSTYEIYTNYRNVSVAYPGIFFRGVQQIQLRTEDRQDGNLGAVAP